MDIFDPFLDIIFFISQIYLCKVTFFKGTSTNEQKRLCLVDSSAFLLNSINNALKKCLNTLRFVSLLFPTEFFYKLFSYTSDIIHNHSHKKMHTHGIDSFIYFYLRYLLFEILKRRQHINLSYGYVDNNCSW